MPQRYHHFLYTFLYYLIFVHSYYVLYLNILGPIMMPNSVIPLSSLAQVELLNYIYAI